MRTVKFTLLAILICAGFILPGYSQTPGVKLLSTGEFTDKSGQVHTWKIDGNHTLVWDGQPYLPVGGVFYSKYICIDQTEENWQADVTALTTLKTAGITDLLLKAIGPVTWTKPEAWQRLVDYLDENGFTYGIDFSDGPKAPLNGFVIDPARYRLPDIIRDSTFEFDMPDVTSAVWMLCSATDGTVVSSGGASVVNGKVKVQISARPDQSCVLLLFPNREFSNGGRDGISDLWAGYDEFRDRLLLFIGKVKFGRGLRFFVDPIASKMDFPDDLLSVIPNSPEFRLEFEAYLAKKYLNIGSLNAAWGLVGDNLTSFQEAARLIPLWHAGRGLPAVYDRAKGKRYTIDAPRSKIWLDIYDFRDASTRNYLNTTADLLKRHSANVPVIYKASRHRQVLSNGNSRGGFDGLGVEAYGKGEELVTKAAGPVYSLAEESARSMWFIVTGTQDTLNRKKSTVGFASRESLLVDFDLLSEIGVKGIFVYGLQVLPEEHWKNHSLVLAPEQLAWLKEFKGKFSTSDRAEFKPDVLFYPTSPVAGADTRRLGPGRWWLPSIRTGSPVNMGETIGGYVLGGQDGFCLWSRIGAQTITIPIESSQKPTLVYPLGAEDILTVQKKKAVIKLTESPILVTGFDPAQAFPIEVVDAEIQKLGLLVKKAQEQGSRVPDVETATDRARSVLRSNRPAIAYDIAHTFVEEIGKEIGTYAWVEGESAAQYSFDKIASALGVSNGGYLSLDTKNHPVMSQYMAAFVLDITKEGFHEIWIAGLPPDVGASPFSFSIDTGPWQQPTYDTIQPYWKEFAWMKIGAANFTKGLHLINIRVDGPGSAGYLFAIDAIVASPGVFTPDGIMKP